MAEAGTPDTERWRIADERAAEWVMRKLARTRQQLAEVDAEMEEYQAQLREWYADRTAGLQRTTEWAEGLLGAWALGQRDADPDAPKVQQLPSGEVRTRWVPPRPVVRDPGAVAASLARAHHPAYDAIVRPKVDINAAELAKATRVADEWEARLTCGCTLQLWQVDSALGVAAGDEWPHRDVDHHADGCLLVQLPTTTLLVERLSAGRRGVLVLPVRQADGSTVVWPVDGLDVAPGRVTATVRVRG